MALNGKCSRRPVKMFYRYCVGKLCFIACGHLVVRLAKHRIEILHL